MNQQGRGDAYCSVRTTRYVRFAKKSIAPKTALKNIRVKFKQSLNSFLSLSHKINKVMVVRWWVIVVCLLLAKASYALSETSEKASDFVYTLADGTQHTLYSLQSEMILLYFYDPTCEDCHELMEQLNTSEIISRLISNKRLLILAVYPEEDMEIWQPYADHIPSTWINGFDKGATINMEGLYNLTSLPAVYLLDDKKNISLQTIRYTEIERELEKK